MRSNSSSSLDNLSELERTALVIYLLYLTLLVADSMSALRELYGGKFSLVEQSLDVVGAVNDTVSDLNDILDKASSDFNSTRLIISVDVPLFVSLLVAVFTVNLGSGT